MEGKVGMLGFCVGGVVGTAITSFIFVSKFEADIIRRGYAQYCPTTGDFAWKGECE